MRCAFFVFSGTGNTLRVCKKLADTLSGRGVEVGFFKIDSRLTLPPERFDSIVIGYPVHAFNAPVLVQKFVKSLPTSDAQKVYFVKTSGEPLALNDASSAKIAKILKRKKYEIAGEFHYVMPYNIIFRHSEGMAARMWQAALRRIPREATIIAEGKTKPIKMGVIKRGVSAVLRIEHTAMPFIGKGFSVRDSCIGCGKCTTVCPVENIVLSDGKPKFGKTCMGCMACSFFCPKDAVKIGLLDGWRVNGSYEFGSNISSDDDICKYCQKAYKRYFHTYESIEENGDRE